MPGIFIEPSSENRVIHKGHEPSPNPVAYCQDIEQIGENTMRDPGEGFGGTSTGGSSTNLDILKQVHGGSAVLLLPSSIKTLSDFVWVVYRVFPYLKVNDRDLASKKVGLFPI
jgi:hypothetical protein